MISLLASLRIGQLAISLVAFLNLLQIRSLSLRVGHTEVIRTLEHQMLQVVSQTCGLCRVVLGTRTHSDIRLDTRFFLVDAEINLQSVLQRVDTGLGHIALHLFIVIL